MLLPAYRLFHYEGATTLDARVGHELHLLIHAGPDASVLSGRGGARSPLACAAAVAEVAHASLTTRLARAVLREPATDWSLHHAATLAGMTSTQFRTQLFREGSAFTSIVREQRLMLALLRLLRLSKHHSDPGRLAAQVGFASQARFDIVFFKHFGCSPGELASRAWGPGLTWTIASLPGQSGT